MDNLNIKGLREDEPRLRGKKRSGRKRFVIQARSVAGPAFRKSEGLSWLWMSLKEWYTHSRYHTESARDEAYTALVKKEENNGWCNSKGERYRRTEYRKA